MNFLLRFQKMALTNSIRILLIRFYVLHSWLTRNMKRTDERLSKKLFLNGMIFLWIRRCRAAPIAASLIRDAYPPPVSPSESGQRGAGPLCSPGALGDFLPAKRSEGCCEISEPPTSLQSWSVQAFLERWNEDVGRFSWRQGNVREAHAISPPPRFGSLTPSFPWVTSPLLLNPFTMK